MIVIILNAIFQALFEWLHGLFLSFLTLVSNSFIQLMTTDLEFFEKYAPIVLEMYDVFTAVGWALLLGNLVFQAMKAMMAGLGGEVENPAALLARTGLYGFLLLCSRQIFAIGLGIGTNIIRLIGIPGAITVTIPDANIFTKYVDASWFLVIIISLIIGISIIKLFFAIGERYVVLCTLVLFAPLGFSMGGSRATKDIATGYIRMFAVMVLMTVLNVVFLRLVLSVLSAVPTAITVIPWTILIVALTRVARKADTIASKIGLNAVPTGSPGGGGAMALTMLAARSLIMKSAAKSAVAGKAAGGNMGKFASAKSKSNGAPKPGNNQQTNSSNPSHSSNSNPNNQSSQTANNNQNNTGVNSNFTAFAGRSNGQSGRSGNRRNMPTNNRSSNNSNSRNYNQTPDNSNARGGKQQPLNGQQNLGNATRNLANNRTINQGGKAVDNKQNTNLAKSPTQINTDRFGVAGSNNSGRNAINSTNLNEVNAGNNSQSSVNQGKNISTPIQGNNQQFSVNQGKNNSPPIQSNNPQSAVNQGKNHGASTVLPQGQPASVKKGSNASASHSASQGVNAQSTGNQGKNAVSTSHRNNAQATVNQGRNIPHFGGNQGKNSVSSSHGNNVQATGNQGRNIPQSSGNKGNNNVSLNQSTNAQSSGIKGRNFNAKTPSVKTQPSSAKQGKNSATPPNSVNKDG